MEFAFNEDKNRQLFEKRGVTFQNVIDAIFEKGILADFPHPNHEKYSNQRIFVVEIKGYTHCIPYVEDNDLIFMKTIFPSRKFMKLLENK